ncbi:MAG TPA: hypothetical protein ENN63_01070 [Bacteroidetes bacterium]|nr:hypothetical protein [Bacteroidota bacterium]
MKTGIAFFILLLAGMHCSGYAQTAEKSAIPDSRAEKKAEVYYFHFTHRCITCKTLEKEAKEAVEELYGDQVFFSAYNLEEEAGKKKGDELGVSYQALLIVSREAIVDLTAEGFLHAGKPDKLKQIMKDTIDPLL